MKRFLKNKKMIASVMSSIFVLGSLSGCGSSGSSVSSLVSGLSMSTYVQDNDDYLQMQVGLSSNSFLLLSATVPIVNPDDPSIHYGSISMQNSLCSGASTSCSASLVVDVNLSKISMLSTGNNLLPNGTSIPIAGLVPNHILGLNVGNSGAKLYLDFNAGEKMIGIAMPFSELNNAGRYVSGLDIFASFKSNSIGGIAGIFAGSGPNQTGIAVFADMSVAQAASVRSGRLASSNSSGGLKLANIKPSAMDEYKLYLALSKLNSHHTALQLK